MGSDSTKADGEMREIFRHLLITSVVKSYVQI